MLRLLGWGVCWAVLMGVTAHAVMAQEAPADAAKNAETAEESAGPAVTVRGVVVNEATGQPVRRALVSVNTTPDRGALTDGEGKFEIHGVPAGLQMFTVSKPGFEEQMGSGEGTMSMTHTVRVASEMPEMSFTLAQKNAIFGHISLSTGTPAEGIGLTLVRQTIEDGRAVWEAGENHLTTPDGGFRFAGLRDGTYVLLTQPEFDNDHAVEPSCSVEAPAAMSGYAAEFNGGATELAGATRIGVGGGQGAEVNLALNQTLFHMVEVSLARTPAGGNWEFKPVLLNHNGEELEYPMHEEKDHSLCVYLPDGSYTLMVRASSEREPGPRGRETGDAAGATSWKEMVGMLDFSVDGRPARNLRVSLAQAPSTPVHLRYQPGPPAPIKHGHQEGGQEGGQASGQADGRVKEEEDDEDEEGDPLSLTLARTNSIEQKSETFSEATRSGESTYDLRAPAPGAYWVEAIAARQGVCVGAVTAGGQNLARTPWVEGPSGTGIPIDVVLRTDCAKLTVQLPESLPEGSAGEGADVFVYAVADFDSVDGVYEGHAEQFGERTATLVDMTPGSYRVYAFRGQRSIEFRNAAALDRLGAGQSVTLAPGGTGNLVLEGIAK